MNRLAVAMDMIAAGTRAPMPMAARQKPANHSGNMRTKEQGHDSRRVFGLNARGQRHEAQQRDQPQQKVVCRHQRGVAPDDIPA